MSKVVGEADLDQSTKRFFYEIRTDTGQVLLKSEPEFTSKAEAEAELIALLHGLGKKVNA